MTRDEIKEATGGCAEGEQAVTTTSSCTIFSHWIKSWSLIDDDSDYLVMAVGVCATGDPKRHYFYSPEILKGCRLKRRLEGCYVATLYIHPASLESCQ